MKAQNKYLTGLLLIPFLFGFTTTSGQETEKETRSFSILDCIEYANAHQTDIRLSELDEEIGEQQIREARGRGLPQINITGNYQDRVKVPLLVIPGFGGEAGSEGIPQGYQYNTTLTGEATQMVYDPSFSVALKAAKTTRELFEQQKLYTKEQTAYAVATAYYEVIVVQKQLELLKSTLDNAQSTLEKTELQYDNGLAKAVDVNRLKVNVNTLQSRIKQTELSLEQTLSQLKFRMGMPIEEPLTVRVIDLEFDEAALQPAAGDDTPDPSQRIDYQILQTNIALQKLDEKNQFSGYFPTLTAFANYGYQAQGAEFGVSPTSDNGWLDFTSAAIGLRLNIPVFDGLQRSARVQQSRLRRLKIKEQISRKKEQVSLEVSNASIQYRNTVERIEAEKQNVDLALQVLDVTRLEFREGVSTSTDVVNAETSLREAQNTYINTLLDLYTARLDLEQAKGNLMDYLLLNN